MLILPAAPASAQSVGIGTVTPAASAALDVTAPANNKGFLPPRLTQAQRDAIGAPATGLMIYNTDSKHLNVWDGTTWTAPISNDETPYVPGSQTFGFTGGPQTYTVPRGVTSVRVDARGASGLPGSANPFPAASRGARAQATLAVTPGEVLLVVVGGAATRNRVDWFLNGVRPPNVGGGGYNGGGNAVLQTVSSSPLPPPQLFRYTSEYQGGGGGATDLRRGGTALTNRVLVAGGGGGAALAAAGGDGGGLTGLAGAAAGGQGGTQTAGGAAGAPSNGNAQAGSLGQGGLGSTFGSSAGGGGGYYGGGGGGGSIGVGGGGGGSSYAAPGGTTGVVFTDGANTGDGVLTISPVPAAQYVAPAISGANIALPGSADGGVVFSSTPGLTTSSQLFWDNSTSRLGVGTNTPAFALHVAGGAYSSGNAAEFTFADRTDNSKRFSWYATNDRATLWHSLGGDRLTVTAAGAVGIGVTIPNQMLHVTGRMQLDGGVIQRGGTTITSTNDLGLYSRVAGNWMRFVTNNAAIRFYADDDRGTTPNVSFMPNGNVGIGTDDPQAKLHVNGGGQMTPTNPIVTYMNRNSGFQHNASVGGNSRPVAAYFTGGQFWVSDIIIAGALNVSSDARIKRIVGVSDRAADLALLNQIKVTDYTYIDQVANTDQVVKKVIAQDIKALMPVAVTTSTQAIPNVYERATRVQCADGHVIVTMAKPHELSTTGGRMRFYTATNADLNVAVTVVDAYTVTFASATAYTELFVYGKYVDDFLSVDYDALAMLNVSATQELARRVALLETQNAALRTHLTQAATDHATLLTVQAQLTRLLGAPTPTATAAVAGK